MINDKTNQYSRLSKVDCIIYLLLTLFFVLNIATFDYSGAKWSVILTFFVLGAFFYVKIITAKKNITLYRVYYIFCFIFMFYAPLQQYLSGVVFQKNNGWILTYSDMDYLRANIILLIFTLLFEIGYHFSKSAKKKETAPSYYTVQTMSSSLILIAISILAILVLLLSGNLFGSEGYDVSNQNVSNQINNILRFIPVSCFIVTILQRRLAPRKQIGLCILFLLEILLVFFPFYGSISRFLLFGVYLSLISLFFSKSKHKSLFFLLYVVGFFFVFSSFNYFKSHTLTDLSDFSLSLANFNFVDFDAYQMLMATISFVEVEGCSFGLNILSAVLNFIPRSIWTGKSLPSGQIVAEYYGTWFTNVSCPIMAEWIFAFGYFGVLIGALILGWLFKKIDGFDDSNSFFKKGFFVMTSGLLVYILRGALLPVMAYTFALTISLACVCIIEKYFCRKVLLACSLKSTRCGMMGGVQNGN